MGQLQLINLTRDAGAVEVGSHELELGEAWKDEVKALLERFTRLQPPARGPEPEVRLCNGTRDYAVQNVSGSLYLKSLDNLNQQNVRVSPAEVVTVMESGLGGLVDQQRVVEQEEEIAEIEAKAVADGRGLVRRTPRHASLVVMVLLAVVSVSLSVAYTFFLDGGAGEAFEFRPVTMEASIKDYLRAHAGRYETQHPTAARAIELSLSGEVQLYQMVLADNEKGYDWRLLVAGTGTFGHSREALGVRTWEGGWIAIRRQGVIEFYGETYVKVK
ncbi:MAG: hypothetical protein ACFBZ8_04475 [Opitutales bacterium]